MKIIFLKDVPRVGRRYEIKEVANGYGRHLVAQGLADIASPQTIAKIEKRRAQDDAERKIHTDLLLKNLEAMANLKLTIKGKANDKGHLFAAIHKNEILAELNHTTRLMMDPEYLILEKPIKAVGEHIVPVEFGDHKVAITVVVEAL